MECSNSECSNPSLDTIVCSICCLSRYCSEFCLKQDLDLNHSKHCQPHTYSLNSFDLSANQNFNMLGRGSYGEVTLVQTHQGEKFALKSISKSEVEIKIPLKLLYREISVHRSLSHKNIIKLHDHLENKDNIYLVLEYAERGNLFNYVKRKRKLSEREA